LASKGVTSAGITPVSFIRVLLFEFCAKRQIASLSRIRRSTSETARVSGKAMTK
jgi:hypothetical protein